MMSLSKGTFTFSGVLGVYAKGFMFDIGTAVFFVVLYALWLLALPKRLNNSLFNRIVTYAGFSLIIFIITFSFFAEFAFWQEFESRFNFIAVDYLVYTYEVINNINESYPLPILISGMLVFVLLIVWLFKKLHIFQHTFTSNTPFKIRLTYTLSIFATGLFYLFFVKNSWAETSRSRYENELSKTGIWSFFQAFKSNELDYDVFYKTIDNAKAFGIVRQTLDGSGVSFSKNPLSIRRQIASTDSLRKPNVIMITVESLSADFLVTFGNKDNITPVLDSLAANSVLFTDLYATGNRTVRGMEALSLSVPPTPGNSIVRREGNEGLFNVGTIFKKAGYSRTFFYGGDGYFDNMNQFFGSNGFDIVDHGKDQLLADKFPAPHHFIPKENIHFENAWGISDEDLYDAVVRDADQKAAAQQPFYDFVMTTSNHKPYTYPENKINIPSGSGRSGAVRYTDYAIGEFIKNIKNKPWYANTIIVIVADHCASSAGKNEIDISKYHIPAMIINLGQKRTIDKMCSQIDIYPTLFNMLGWNYESNLFGKNVLAENYSPRIIVGTYQKLAYMKGDSLTILGPQKTVENFIYDRKNNQQNPALFIYPAEEAISQYQIAYKLFKNGGMKE